MSRRITMGMFFVTVGAMAVAAKATPLPVPLVYYDFQTGLDNKGSLGSADNATAPLLSGALVTNTPAAATPGGAGINGNGLSVLNADKQYINSPITNTQAGTNFAISAWFRLDPSGANGNRMYVYEDGTNTTEYNVSFGTVGAVALNATAAPSYETFDAEVAPTTGGNSYSESLNTWHNVVQSFAVSGSNTVMTTYIDGALISTATASTSALTFSSLDIGTARPGQTRFFNGSIDEFAVFGSSLDQSQVAEIYNNGAPTELPTGVPEPATLAIFGLVTALGLIRRRRALIG